MLELDAGDFIKGINWNFVGGENDECEMGGMDGINDIEADGWMHWLFAGYASSDCILINVDSTLDTVSNKNISFIVEPGSEFTLPLSPVGEKFIFEVCKVSHRKNKIWLREKEAPKKTRVVR